MKIRKELWFGFIIMGLIIAGTATMLLMAPTITNGHLGLMMLGLVVVALSLRREFPLMAMSIGGIAFTHITMSLTNANSQTNNYSVVFGLAMTVVFQLRASRSGARPAMPT